MTATSPSRPTIVALSTLLYRWLLTLGPSAFRREYSAPAVQDFRRCCIDAYNARGTLGVLLLWPLLFGEEIMGLLAEYITEIFGRKRTERAGRAYAPTIVAAFWAFVLFSLACIALGRTTDPAGPFDAVGRAHPEIAIAYAIVVYSFDIALLAVVLGGLPILFIAVKRAMPGGLLSVLKLFAVKPRQALKLLGASFLITVVFLALLLGTEAISGLPPCTATNGCVAGQPWFVIAGGFAAIIAVVTLLVSVVLAITASLSLAVLRTEFGAVMLRFALAPITILALVMAASTLAATFWTIRLWVVAPRFAASSSGLGNGQTLWVIAIIAAMALSTMIAAGALWSGARASRARAAL